MATATETEIPSEFARLTPEHEFSVPWQGRFKFRGVRFEKSGDLVITGVGGKAGHSQFRSFKISGPTKQAPAKVKLHRKGKLR